MLEHPQIVTAAIRLFVWGHHVDRKLPVILDAVFLVVAIVYPLIKEEKDNGVFIPKDILKPVSDLLVLGAAIDDKALRLEAVLDLSDKIRHRRDPRGVIDSRSVGGDDGGDQQQDSQKNRKRPLHS